LATSCELVGNPGCQLGLPTSFQLVRLVECSHKQLLISRLLQNPAPLCQVSELYAATAF